MYCNQQWEMEEMEASDRVGNQFSVQRTQLVSPVHYQLPSTTLLKTDHLQLLSSRFFQTTWDNKTPRDRTSVFDPAPGSRFSPIGHPPPSIESKGMKEEKNPKSDSH